MLSFIKETASQDFFTQGFFMNYFPPSSDNSLSAILIFFRKFKENNDCLTRGAPRCKWHWRQINRWRRFTCGKFTVEVNDTDANIFPNIYTDCTAVTSAVKLPLVTDAGHDTFHLI